MFNAYPDSCGGTLGDAVALLARDELNGAFSLFYILPSMFRSDFGNLLRFGTGAGDTR
jgi:sucrose phosphorylase